MTPSNAVTAMFALLATGSFAALAQEPEATLNAPIVNLEVLPDQVYVADDPAAGTLEEAEAPISDEELLRREFLLYRELMDEGVIDEADSVAKRVIELSIRLHGPDSINTARALTNLAIVQQMNEQYGAAQQNFQSAIDVIEDREDRLNALLINPLKGLGKAQLDSGRPDLAAQTFQRAVHITHVNEGPHNMDQLELLESLAETNLRLGLVEESRRVTDTVYALNERYYQDDQMALVPSLTRRAIWQNRTGYINDEKATYRRIVRIIETNAGESDPRLIQPLISLGRSYFFIDQSEVILRRNQNLSSGERYFNRALRIAKENGDAHWPQIADSMLALGDYHLLTGSQPRAASQYQEAWELLSKDEERLRRRDILLAQPVLLRGNPLPRFADSASGSDFANNNVALQEGHMEYEFDVSLHGRVRAFQVVRQTPSEFADFTRYSAREMRGRRYRPAMSDDGPVSIENLTGTHRFYYKQSDLDALRLDMEESEKDTETTSEPEEPSN